MRDEITELTHFNATIDEVRLDMQEKFVHAFDLIDSADILSLEVPSLIENILLGNRNSDIDIRMSAYCSRLHPFEQGNLTKFCFVCKS